MIVTESRNSPAEQFSGDYTKLVSCMLHHHALNLHGLSGPKMEMPSFGLQLCSVAPSQPLLVSRVQANGVIFLVHACCSWVDFQECYEQACMIIPCGIGNFFHAYASICVRVQGRQQDA